MNPLRANFVSCTPLINIKNRTADDIDIIELEWSFDNNTPQNRKRIDIYRFIGGVDECFKISNVLQNNRPQKIFSATQLGADVSTTAYFPTQVISLLPSTILESMSKEIIDDIFNISDNGYNLNNFHHLGNNPPSNNISIVNDIKNTKRVLCYFIKTIFDGDVDDGVLDDVDMIFPIPTPPTISLSVNGIQSNPGYQDFPAECYDWKDTQKIKNGNGTYYLSGYDDLSVTFTVDITPGTYKIDNIELKTDDIYPLFLSDSPNEEKIMGVVVDDRANITYTYHTPSMLGNKGSRTPLVHPLMKNIGFYNPTVRPYLTDIYNQNNAPKCEDINVSADAVITVFERTPETKFIASPHDNARIRRDLFCGKSWDWDRYSRKAHRESGSSDAKKLDVLYGVDALSASILDRSICRSFPITSWMFEISTNNNMISWYPTITCNITAEPDYWNNQDIQSSFNPLTSLLWRYGDYCITLMATAGVEDKFAFLMTETSSVTTRYDDLNNDCGQYYEKFTSFTRDVCASIFTHNRIYSDWNIIEAMCYPPDVREVTKHTPCKTGEEGPGYTKGMQITTTYFSNKELSGNWYDISGSCYMIVPPPAPTGNYNPATDPVCLGTLILNNDGVLKSGDDGYTYYKYARKIDDKFLSGQHVMYDFENDITKSFSPNIPLSTIRDDLLINKIKKTRYDSITGGVLYEFPYGYEYLNGLVIESIYINSPKMLNWPYMPDASYVWPLSPIGPIPYDTHICNRAYFEAWVTNSTATSTITIYLCSARDVYGPGTTKDHTITPEPHKHVTWLRVTKNGNTLYNGFPHGFVLSGIPWK